MRLSVFGSTAVKRSLVWSITALALPIILLGFSSSASAIAASISLSATGAATVADTDEYFTSQGNPRDMDSVCDIGPDGWMYYPESVSGGIWTGVNPGGAGPNISPLPIAFPGTLAAHHENCTKLGNHAPIDSSKYRRISFKMRSSYPSSWGVVWTQSTSEAPGRGFLSYDGYYLPGAGVPTAANAWTIKNQYLPGSSSTINWSGNIYGVTILPSTALPAGSTTQFQWIRIIDPSTSPTINFAWNGAGSGSANDNVVLYVDNDNSGFDGAPVQRGLSHNSSLNFETGVLPPGTYYFYARLETSYDGINPAVAATSNYWGPLTIDAAPTARFTSPSHYSGSEYSHNEVGNDWDMNDQSDLVNLYNSDGTPMSAAYKGFHDWSFSSGYFFATSDADTTGNTTDTQMHLNVPSNKPIDTSKYRFFCVNIQIDSTSLTRTGSAALLDQAGWIGRLVWVRNGSIGGGILGSTRGHQFQESSGTYPDSTNGYVTYCYDLWTEPAESGTAWLSMNHVTTLRFDPLEATPATRFSVNWAGLFKENASSSNQYSIGLRLADPDDSSLTVSLYYDNDNSGYNGTLITSQSGVAPGDRSFTWDTSSVTAGSYYVYAVVTDGVNTSRFYSDVIVKVNPSTSSSLYRHTPGDFDGDGKTDFTIFRRGAANVGTWYTSYSSTGGYEVRSWGDTSLDIPRDADVDGDRLSDEFVSRAKIEVGITSYAIKSHTNSAFVQPWGLRTDIPITNDIDGDAKSDTTIYRPSDGSWWSIRTALPPLVFSWGLPGDIPTPADYDGDGWDDIAIWRPSVGFWAVAQSSRGASKNLEDIIWKQWGLGFLNDHPMPGDYDGDGKADLAVWRPSTGVWFFCKSTNNFDCSNAAEQLGTQFGLPGDYPISGDFDGDGKLDPAVWRSSNGTWYWKQSSNGQIMTKQWGLPGDTPLGTGTRDLMYSLGYSSLPRQ